MYAPLRQASKILRAAAPPQPINNEASLNFQPEKIQMHQTSLNEEKNDLKQYALREASLFMGWGGRQLAGGASEIGRPAKGGRKILDACRRGGEKFWTSPEGGAKNFRLDDFFFNVPKTQLFQVFLGILGTFHFLV